MQEILQTIQNYTKAFGDIWRHRPLIYLIIPGIITWIVLYLLYYFTSPWAESMESWFTSKYPFDKGSSTLEWIISKFSILLYIGVFIFLFKYILFIVMSPFMSLLSEDIEQNLRSDIIQPKFKVSTFISDIMRGIRITIRNMGQELFIIAILFLLSFIPGAQIITAPLIFLTQAYYAGFGNMDYTLERYYNLSDTANYVKRNRIMAISNGSVFLLILAIPVVGWFLAVPLATSAATRSIVNKI